MRFLRSRNGLLAAALVWLVAAPAACQAPRDTIDVLYLGNSYVYFNNLPALVEGISAGLDGPIVRGAAHTHGGATLRGHLEDGHLPAIFSRVPVGGGGWDWIPFRRGCRFPSTHRVEGCGRGREWRGAGFFQAGLAPVRPPGGPTT